MNRKLNIFFKNTLFIFVIVSLLLNGFGIICSKIDGYEMISSILFLMSLLFTGLPIFFKAYQSLMSKVIGIELLVTIAVIGAICIREYSEAGIVCLLFQFGYYLELKTLEKTRGAIKELVKSAPKVALRIEDGLEEEIDVDEVEIEDTLALHAGRVVAVDGTIVEKEGYFIEASITGESKPIYKKSGDFVYAGAIVDNGDLLMRADKESDDSTYQKIISLVEEASDNKSKMEKYIDRFAKYYTPLVIVLSVLTLLISYIVKGQWDIDTSITVLVLACPGALVIGVPVASVAGIGKASRHLILCKGGDTISAFAKSDVFVFDKTGTLTQGNSKVIQSYYFGKNQKMDEQMIYSMEAKSNHPLSKAILELYDYEVLDISTVTEKGKGICCEEYILGNIRFMKEHEVDLSKRMDCIQSVLNHGSSIVLASKNKELIAIYEIADEIKEDAKEMIRQLIQHQKRVILLSGDNELVCRNVCEQLHIQEYYSELLPEEKMNKIQELQKNHVVTFVGDGINDSPALMLADIGVSMGSATDVAIETSDVVLLKENMISLVEAYSIAKKTIRISYENIMIAIGTVLLLLAGLFMNYIHMTMGMLIHECSILIVIVNAMRLLIERRK